MSEEIILPEVIAFAGPNGSGKSTITRMAKIKGRYINADDIKRVNFSSDLDAAIEAESLREKALSDKADFTFETVLSTDRNLNLLRRAKESGYFVRIIYVLTANPDINVARVRIRETSGGHGVPEDKIRSRYEKALKLIPELVEVSDIMHIYDNSSEPFRIFKKRKDKCFHWENTYWDYEKISELTGINDFEN